MRAVIFKSYGSEDVLELVEKPMPSPKSNEVLVNVKAISLNPKDIGARSGEYKIIMNRKFPKSTGSDLASIVTSIGSDVKKFKVGDEVFGYQPSFSNGTAADFTTISEDFIALKPKELSFEQAAALGCVYLTALQTLRDKCKIKRGDKIAIYGASGGVGTAAVQLAKYFGAEVTAVSNSRNETYCRNQGANHFIAYDKADIFASPEKYDVFFQVFAKNTAFYDKAKKILKADGIFICLIPLPKYIFKILFAKPAFKFTLVKSKSEDLAFIANLAVQQLIKPAISETFKLPEIKEAHKALSAGKVAGKIIVTMF